MFVNEWQGSVRSRRLPIAQGGVDLPYTDAIGGFKNPVGVMPTPLVSIAHPRPGVKIGKRVSPVYLLRDPTAVKLTCRIETISGIVLATEVRTPDPAKTAIDPGFGTCGAFDVGSHAAVVVVVEVESKHADGKAPTYRTRRVASRLF